MKIKCKVAKKKCTESEKYHWTSKWQTDEITHHHKVCIYTIHSIWPLSRPETQEQRQYIDNWYTGINSVQQAYTVCFG